MFPLPTGRICNGKNSIEGIDANKRFFHFLSIQLFLFPFVVQNVRTDHVFSFVCSTFFEVNREERREEQGRRVERRVKKKSKAQEE